MEMIADSKEVAEAQSLLWNQTFNYMTSMALRCSVQLGIPDVISSQHGPVTVSDIVTQLSIPKAKSNHLYRLMRVLAHTGVFALQKDRDGREGYLLTNLSMLLTKKYPINLSPWIVLGTEPAFVNPCFFTAEWFHGSSPTPFEAVHGMNLYDYTGRHPDFNEKFNTGNACDAEWVIKSLIDDLKPMFEGSKSLVDVGGNNGTVAKAISKAVPHLKCSVYDLPHVIADIKEANNVTPIAGNMFEFVPSADIIMLKTVLGDWSDEDCLKILKRCKEAITREGGRGKLIIVGLVVPDNFQTDSEPTLTELLTEISIITCLNSKERTEIELKEILLDAGFTSYKITPAAGANSRSIVNSIVEVFP